MGARIKQPFQRDPFGGMKREEVGSQTVRFLPREHKPPTILAWIMLAFWGLIGWLIWRARR
jgi:hypothetical protein